MQTRTKQKKYEVNSVGNIRFVRLFHNISLYTIAGAVMASTLAAPCHSFEVEEKNLSINLNEIAFLLRIEKLYERAKRYVDKLEYGKLIDVMFEIKTEVEGYTRKKIDIDAHIDTIEKEAKKQGANFKKGEIKKIKKDLKKRFKKKNHKAIFLYKCNLYDIEFSQEQCDFDFYSKNVAKSSHAKQGQENEEEVKVPIRVSVGVTASLCGYFLSFIPHPYAQAASKFLISTGLGLCIDGTINRLEEDEKKQQNQQ